MVILLVGVNEKRKRRKNHVDFFDAFLNFFSFFERKIITHIIIEKIPTKFNKHIFHSMEIDNELTAIQVDITVKPSDGLRRLEGLIVAFGYKSFYDFLCISQNK
jgi:hypothetical protein